MDGKEAKSYFRTLGEVTTGGSKASIRELVQTEKQTPEYLEALDTLKKLKKPRPTILQATQTLNPDSSPVVENHTQTETPAENPDTFNHEAAINLAYSVLDKYGELKQSIADKNKLPGREGVKKDRAQLTTLLNSTAKTVMDDPRLFEPIFTTWKAQPLDENGETANALFNDVKGQVAEQIKKRPDLVTDAHLISWLQLYSKNILIREVGESLLTEFFNAQKTESQRVNATYDLLLTSAQLVDDVDSVQSIFNILSLNTPIIPIHSDYYYNHFISMTTLSDEDTMERARIIQSSLIWLKDISTSTSISSEQSTGESKMHDRWSNYWGHEKAQIKLGDWLKASEMRGIKMYGAENAKKRIEELGTDYHNTFGRFNSRAKQDKFADDIRLLERTIKPRADIAAEKRLFIAEYPGEYQCVTVQTSNLTLEILIPEGIPKLEALKVITNHSNAPWNDEFDYVRFVQHEVQGKYVGVIEHKTFNELAEVHPISVVSEVGLPNPEGVGNLAEKNAQTAGEIRVQQRRFMDKRGVVIPIQNEELQKLGYTFIAFGAHENNPRSIVGELLILNHPYAVTLDENFNLNFEGKNFQGSQQDELQHLLLTYLRPILCDELENTEGQKLSEHTLTVLKRKAHIRCLPLLPDGRPSKATPEQARVYLKEQGRDLATTNLEKQIAGDCRENRGFHNHTYVKAVEKENAPDLGPQNLSINPDLGY